MFSWDPTLGVMQNLEYLLGVEHEVDGNANGRKPIFA